MLLDLFLKLLFLSVLIHGVLFSGCLDILDYLLEMYFKIICKNKLRPRGDDVFLQRGLWFASAGHLGAMSD